MISPRGASKVGGFAGFGGVGCGQDLTGMSESLLVMWGSPQ